MKENREIHEHEHGHIHEQEQGYVHEYGHEHGHGYVHECCQEHEHGQDHAHECGQEHGQDHAHEHGHGHHHSHGGEETASVLVSVHDEAVIGSVKCAIGGSYDDAVQELCRCMRDTAKKVEAAGGFIGHIKSFAKEEARNSTVSITDGEEIRIKDGQGNGISAECANIVFGITPGQLEAILKDTFSSWLL